MNDITGSAPTPPIPPRFPGNIGGGLPGIPGKPDAPAGLPPLANPSRATNPMTIPERAPAAAPVPEVPAPEDVTDTGTFLSRALKEEAEAREAAELHRQERLSNLSARDSDSAVKLMSLLNDDEVSEVFLNARDSITFLKNGIRLMQRDIQFSSTLAYHTVIDCLILHYADTNERIENTEYRIEALMELPSETFGEPPTFARVHIMAPPQRKEATVAIAKKARRAFTMQDLVSKGSLTPNMAQFLIAATKARVTMVYSGRSGSGKTTNLDALVQEFDPTDRIILIEDTPELRIPGQDLVASISSTMKPGMDKNRQVTMEWLVQQANRQRPDRILVGEVRGPEMNEFLIAANSGADGSITTLHARNARGAITKMVSLCMYGESAKSEEAILRDIASSVQIIVQLGRVGDKQVMMEIVELEDAVRGGSVPMNTLFRYNRSTRRHEAVARPTDSLIEYMSERGVAVDLSWFHRTGNGQ